MAYPNNGHLKPMSTVEATDYVRKMIHRKSSQPGDAERVMQQIETDYGIGFWTLDHLRKGRAKSVEIGLFQRIRAAYLDVCERQVKKLLQEIAIEKAVQDDDDLADIEAQAEALVSRLQSFKRK